MGLLVASGIANVKIIECAMDKEVYLDVIKNNLQPSAEKLGFSVNDYFQQDNYSKHCASMVII